MYIILGEFVDEAPIVQAITPTWMSIIQSIRQKKTHYLTTHDYIWRWDTDWFWCSKHFGMNRRILRFLFGKFMLAFSVYWKINHLLRPILFKTFSKLFEKPSESVIQDILIPISERTQSSYDFFHDSIGITPIWICPFHFYRRIPIILSC